MVKDWADKRSRAVGKGERVKFADACRASTYAFRRLVEAPEMK